MKNTLFLFAFLISHISYSQCFFTAAEYEAYLERFDTLDQIAGLWCLSGETRLYKGDSLIMEQEDPFLDFWYVVPGNEGYNVCHTEYTQLQDFDAAFIPEGDDAYTYVIQYDTAEIVGAFAQMLDTSTAKDYSQKVVAYELSPSDSKARKMGAKADEQIHWTFYWSSATSDRWNRYKKIAQKVMFEQMDSMYSDHIWSDDELFDIRKTMKNIYVATIRRDLDMGIYRSWVGSKYLPEDLGQDPFSVISVNELFPGRLSYFIQFKNHYEQIWKIEFDHSDPMEEPRIISVNKSHFHNDDSARLFLSLHKDFDNNYWK